MDKLGRELFDLYNEHTGYSAVVNVLGEMDDKTIREITQYFKQMLEKDSNFDNSELNELEEKVNSKKLELKELERDFASREKEVFKLNREFVKYSTTRKNAISATEEAVEESKEAKEELKKVQLKLNQTQEDLTDRKNKLTYIQGELSKAKPLLEEFEKELKRVKGDINLGSEELRELKEEVGRLEDKKDSLLNNIENTSKDLERLKEEVEKLENNKKTLTELEENLLDQLTERLQPKSNTSELEKELKELKSLIGESTGTILTEMKDHKAVEIVTEVNKVVREISASEDLYNSALEDYVRENVRLKNRISKQAQELNYLNRTVRDSPRDYIHKYKISEEIWDEVLGHNYRLTGFSPAQIAEFKEEVNFQSMSLELELDIMWARCNFNDKVPLRLYSSVDKVIDKLYIDKVEMKSELAQLVTENNNYEGYLRRMGVLYEHQVGKYFLTIHLDEDAVDRLQDEVVKEHVKEVLEEYNSKGDLSVFFRSGIPESLIDLVRKYDGDPTVRLINAIMFPFIKTPKRLVMNGDFITELSDYYSRTNGTFLEQLKKMVEDGLVDLDEFRERSLTEVIFSVKISQELRYHIPFLTNEFGIDYLSTYNREREIRGVNLMNSLKNVIELKGDEESRGLSSEERLKSYISPLVYLITL